MKISKRYLDKLIRETVEDMTNSQPSSFSAPAGAGFPEEVFSDLSLALTALRNASEGLRHSGLDSTEVDDAYFKIKRYLKTKE